MSEIIKNHTFWKNPFPPHPHSLYLVLVLGIGIAIFFIVLGIGIAYFLLAPIGPVVELLLVQFLIISDLTSQSQI